MKLGSCAAVMLASLTMQAFAHTPLQSSMPADRTTVTAPVREIVLEFGSDVRLTAIVLVDSHGQSKKVAEAPIEIASKFALAVREELTPEDFVASWRAVGADTHVVSGEIKFTVEPAVSH